MRTHSNLDGNSCILTSVLLIKNSCYYSSLDAAARLPNVAEATTNRYFIHNTSSLVLVLVHCDSLSTTLSDCGKQLVVELVINFGKNVCVCVCVCVFVSSVSPQPQVFTHNVQSSPARLCPLAEVSYIVHYVAERLEPSWLARDRFAGSLRRQECQDCSGGKHYSHAPYSTGDVRSWAPLAET